ncbi:MAG: beta-ketoacyl synthase N-terminal-like domain-containing protein, partial [Vicinamibacterales bacterium]
MLGLVHEYAHGYVVVPVVLACRKRRLFELLESERRASFSRLTRELHANPGHLRVAMTLFESLGTVARRDDEYTLVGPTSCYHRIPESAGDLLSLSMASYLDGSGASLQPWIDLSRRAWDVSDEPIARMLDGVIVTPLMATLAPLGDWSDARRVADVWRTLERAGTQVPDRVRTELAGFFHAQDWSAAASPDAPLTSRGKFLFSRPFLFGIVGSYRPMLARMDDLLFGACADVFARDELGRERHVDRTLNVVGSGRQHAKYFGDLTQVVVDIFDTDAFDTQPACVADMGCGDGTLLRHVHEVVTSRTRRGPHLQRFPLTLVGIDCNEASLAASAVTLRGLDHLLLRGDIGQPGEVVAALARHGIHDLDRVLHIRSFMDHDRPYVPPADRAAAAATAGRGMFEPAFVDRDGAEIHPAAAYRSLVEHLERWAAVLGTQPLVVLETHSLPPGVVRRHVTECENLHFDACQRFSHQLLVDANHFLLAAAEAGLFPRGDVRRYPRTLGFTRITLAAFERRTYRVRWARLEDLGALERLEQECWAQGLQTPPEILRRRVEQYPQGQFVVEMNGRVAGVLYTQRIADAQVLERATSDTVDAYHRETGTMVQLIALNIAHDAQQFGLGDQLLELVLQYHEVSSDVQSIVGVSRCKDYWKHRHLTHDEYIRLRDDSGLPADPVLRFHERHGAEIQRSLARYRPNDAENHGYGVLIAYAVDGRRRRSPAAAPAAGEDADRPAPRDAAVDIEAFLRRTTARILDRDDSAVSLDTPLMEMGLDSFALTELGVHVGSRFALRLEPTFFFHHNTLSAIASFLRTRATPRPPEAGAAEVRRAGAASPEDARGVAIVGIACRLPGGISSPGELWQALSAGRSLVGSVGDIRWRWSGTSGPAVDEAVPAHVAHIDGIEHFDAGFFSISPAEAMLMDPQQRLLLELSWHCVEDAGYDPRALAGSATGVFVGVSGSDYKTLHDKLGEEVGGHYALATSTSMIPNRISYAFDFCGPSVQTDTACSSSLVAIHQAVRSLAGGECDAALAGGVSVICEASNGIAYARAGMLASDGRCKAFDAGSNGYVRGEGAVLFFLKPLANARADKDRIYATIIGSAMNHGGRAAGLTAPNPRQQAALLTSAWRAAGITPDRLGYIEAHGTGTALGDPIEIEGLRAAFAAAAPAARGGRCAVGSVKTNIGHLEAAAGAAGLLKA